MSEQQNTICTEINREEHVINLDYIEQVIEDAEEKKDEDEVFDLDSKNLSIDVNNNFEPHYIVNPDKKIVVGGVGPSTIDMSQPSIDYIIKGEAEIKLLNFAI
jgi:hypothetical protein